MIKMKKISEIIIEDNLNKEYTELRVRKTARGIIFNNNRDKILMVFSKHYNDYTFPGGGIRDDEDIIEGLKRELSEEIGALEITNIREFGQLEELKNSYKHQSTNIYHQISYYFLVDVIRFGKPNLIEAEIRQGLTAVWVEPEVALKHNMIAIDDELHQKQGIKTALIRENIILEKILGGIDEKV